MQKYAFHLDPPKKCFTPTLGVNTKTCLIGFHPPNKCSKVLVTISQKFCCREETCAIQKLFKKREKESIEKMDKCPRYLKQWVLRCPPKKKIKRDE